MPNQVLVENGTPIVFANSGDFSGTANGYTRSAQINLTSLANTDSRQSDKVDLGANRAAQYAVRVGIEFAVAPTAGNTVEFYWSSSTSATAGTGNDGGTTGSDAAYKAGEEAEWQKQLILLGVLVVTNDATTVVQYQTIGRFAPPERYGQIVVYNGSGQALVADAVEMFVALVPLIDEIQ